MIDPAASENRGGYKQINKSLNVCAFDDYLEAQQLRLPAIPDVEQISERVVRIMGQNPGKFTLQGTNTYLVGTGPNRILIDTAQGKPAWIKLVAATLASLDIYISHVLLTHWHGDHTGGVPDLLRLDPLLAERIYKHTPTKSQNPLVDGQMISVPGATVRAVHAPGHSADHMVFILEEENTMFTGDNILGHGTAAVEHLSTWMASLQVMAAKGCAVGFPAHGVVVPDLPGKIVAEVQSKTRRETQVLRAMGRGGAHIRLGKNKTALTVKALVTAMHGNDLDPKVRELAVEPFIGEVLRKLAEDGKVAWMMKGGEKKWFSLALDDRVQ